MELKITAQIRYPITPVKNSHPLTDKFVEYAKHRLREEFWPNIEIDEATMVVEITEDDGSILKF